MSLKFSTGEQPIEPLVLTLTNENGSVIDLTGLDSVVLEGDGLPAGVTNILSATEGRVQYAFTAPFIKAGIVLVRAKLIEGEAVDYTGYLELDVTNASETGAGIVTTWQVESITGQTVSRQDIARAQFMIGILVGVDLDDAEWYALQSVWDKHWLVQAVAYQASANRMKPDDQDSAQYSSVTVGDVSVTYRDSASADGLSLAPLAKLALARLSWRRARTIHPRSLLGENVEIYTNENSFMWPVVRTDLPSYDYTWRLV